MTPYDFYVVKTEDGEIRVVRNYEEAEKLAKFYIDHYDGAPYSIRGHFFGDSI